MFLQVTPKFTQISDHQLGSKAFFAQVSMVSKGEHITNVQTVSSAKYKRCKREGHVKSSSAFTDG